MNHPKFIYMINDHIGRLMKRVAVEGYNDDRTMYFARDDENSRVTTRDMGDKYSNMNKILYLLMIEPESYEAEELAKKYRI